MRDIIHIMHFLKHRVHFATTGTKSRNVPIELRSIQPFFKISRTHVYMNNIFIADPL